MGRWRWQGQHPCGRRWRVLLQAQQVDAAATVRANRRQRAAAPPPPPPPPKGDEGMTPRQQHGAGVVGKVLRLRKPVVEAAAVTLRQMHNAVVVEVVTPPRVQRPVVQRETVVAGL